MGSSSSSIYTSTSSETCGSNKDKVRSSMKKGCVMFGFIFIICD